jgi:hypothetical protein
VASVLSEHGGGSFRLPGRGVAVPHPIAAGNRLEGLDCQGWRLRHRLGDATGGSALDWPALEGYTIGSG